MYDVVIIGGGPAGSTMGSYLSKAGIKNLILDGHNHPRPHVGESLVLSTMRVFGELGLIDKMDQAGFAKKFGASWRDFNGKEEALHVRQFKLKQNDEIFNQYPVHGCYETVERAENPKTADYIHIYFLPVNRGCAWHIPITDKITSVGIVAAREVFQQFKSESERYF